MTADHGAQRQPASVPQIKAQVRRALQAMENFASCEHERCRCEGCHAVFDWRAWREVSRIDHAELARLRAENERYRAALQSIRELSPLRCTSREHFEASVYELAADALLGKDRR